MNKKQYKEDQDFKKEIQLIFEKELNNLLSNSGGDLKNVRVEISIHTSNFSRGSQFNETNEVE